MTEIQTTVLNDIQTIMIDTSLDNTFFEMVLSRLDSFGYELKETDAWFLCFSMQKQEKHIFHSCNIQAIPQDLYYVLCDMVCGDFLNQLLTLGKLSDDDLNGVIQSITIGDTSTTFANGTDKQTMFRTLMGGMMNRDGDLVCFRKMTW